LFEEVPIELCRYTLPLADGRTLLAVQERFIDGSLMAPGRFMLFDANWVPDLSFTNQFVGDRRSSITLKLQPDGKILVAGLVGTYNGEGCSGVMRLQSDGQIDRSFRCVITNALEGRVMDMALQEDGRIVICGYFSEVGEVEVPHIARLNPDGSLDTTFRPPFMTQKQFDKERLGKQLKLPVVRLTQIPSTSASTNRLASTSGESPQTIVITSLRLMGDRAEIQFAGAANQHYVLQAKDALGGADWININTNRTGRSGSAVFYDNKVGEHPMRFYRIAVP